VVKAAEVVRRLHEHRPETQIHEVWRRFVTSLGYPEEFTAPLLDPDQILGALDALPLAMGRQFHACTHTTIAPNIVHGGTKINTIPDRVELELDIRTLPGQTEDEIRAIIADALGDLAGAVEVDLIRFDASTASAIDTPLWDSLARTSQRFYEGSALIPMLTVGATDARFFRSAGSTAYGYGLFSRRLTFEDYGVMFHGDDERVDVDSLLLSTRLWEAVATDLLGTDR
jgi:acetylornithine deacetylase/succinyl-diaminopimelate desuccinylase-like protein